MGEGEGEEEEEEEEEGEEEEMEFEEDNGDDWWDDEDEYEDEYEEDDEVNSDASVLVPVASEVSIPLTSTFGGLSKRFGPSIRGPLTRVGSRKGHVERAKPIRSLARSKIV